MCERAVDHECMEDVTPSFLDFDWISPLLLVVHSRYDHKCLEILPIKNKPRSDSLLQSCAGILYPRRTDKKAVDVLSSCHHI